MTRPVLVGWARAARYPGEPLDAWAHALTATGVDPRAIDSLDVVYCHSWAYDDPPGRLAAAVGAAPRRASYSGIGGTTPLTLLGAAGARISAGQADVCAVVGGEQLATLRRVKKQGGRPAWSHRDPVERPFPFEAPLHQSEVAHRVLQAYTTFALRDVARRARVGASAGEYRDGLGRLFAPMTEVAAADPCAWFRTARSADELTTVTASNRMVAYPYTKLLTAIMDVDLAAAAVVASEEAADRIGTPAERRVYLRSWAEARDPDYVAEHPDLSRSPAMKRAFHQALAAAGSSVDDVSHFDIYSCFPASVSFSLDALGLDSAAPGPYTVTGGLPYAGGPGSSYALGAVAAMADVLVADPGALGMVTAVGMHLSKHAALLLSTRPGPAAPAPVPAPLPVGGSAVPIVDQAEGEGRVAAYTVLHGSDGSASTAVMVCDVGPGARCYAAVDHPDLLAALEADEHVGRTVTLRRDGARNLARW